MVRKPVKILMFTAISVLCLSLTRSSFAFLENIQSQKASSLPDFFIISTGGGYVQREFSSIQEAINAAENGSTIHVPSAVYYEHIILNKTVSLVAENVSTTIIEGSGGGTVVEITADNVSITGFTVQNSGWGWYRNGIHVHSADNCEIRGNYLSNNCHNIRLNYSRGSTVANNMVDGNGYGIRLINSRDCVAINNNVSNCIGGVHLENATGCFVNRNYFFENSQGIRLYSPCVGNRITANTVYSNTYEGMIETMPGNTTFHKNLFFHNSFIDNAEAFIYKASGNIWDYGYPSGGNYWSRYNGTDMCSGPQQNDTGSDGIGDTPHPVGGPDVDDYPLMYPWGILPVHSIDTGSGYSLIQDAIDAAETLDGHTLWIDSGVYKQNVGVDKSLSLIGEDRSTTIIDGNNIGTVLSLNADNVSIIGLTICNSGMLYPPYGDDCGVFLDHVTGCSFVNNVVMNNRIGVYLFFSVNNTIEANAISSNSENGILLWYSGNNVLTKNKMSNNSANFGVHGGSFSNFNNTIDTSNIVDQKPIQYIIGIEDEVLDDQMDIGVLYLISCSNMTVRNLTLTKNVHAVFCYSVTESKIEDVTASENNYGIYLHDSDNNTVTNNYCSRNWVGICLQHSNHNVVKSNFAEKCEKGISLYEAGNSNITCNTLQQNLYGIRLYSSYNNIFFHNSLISNTEQASLISSFLNTWDNGCEGNYWSDYNGSDTDGDGIGDTYVPWGNIDYFPLMNPYWNPADINHDSIVDIYDVVICCGAYGSTPSHSDWNPHCDIAEPYMIIDIDDVALICESYGQEMGNF